MKSLINSYPHYEHKENLKLINNEIYKTYDKRLFITFCIIFYPLCFGLGMMMFNYHSKFIHSAFYFLIFLVIFFIVSPILYLNISRILIQIKTNTKDITQGIMFKYIDFYVLINKILSYKELIWCKVTPMCLLNGITLIIFIFFPSMISYAALCSTMLLSVHNLLDLYILIKFKTNNVKYIKIDNKLYTLK